MRMQKGFISVVYGLILATVAAVTAINFVPHSKVQMWNGIESGNVPAQQENVKAVPQTLKPAAGNNN